MPYMCHRPGNTLGLLVPSIRRPLRIWQRAIYEVICSLQTSLLVSGAALAGKKLQAGDSWPSSHMAFPLYICLKYGNIYNQGSDTQANTKDLLQLELTNQKLCLLGYPILFCN